MYEIISACLNFNLLVLNKPVKKGLKWVQKLTAEEVMQLMCTKG